MISQHKQHFCENCNYFRMHYFLFKGILIPTHNGHCLFSRRIGLVDYHNSCDKLKADKNIQSQQSEAIEKILLRTAKQIEEIAAILKTDK